MGRYFARKTTWIAILVILCQGYVGAEEVAASDPLGELHAGGNAPLFRHSSYPAAWTAAQQSNRPILVYVGMPHCPYCVKMMEKTYRLPAVEKLVSSSFETVHAGRFTHAELVRKLNVKWYPTTILVGPNNQVLDMIEGYVEAKAFQRRLQTGLASSARAIQR